MVGVGFWLFPEETYQIYLDVCIFSVSSSLLSRERIIYGLFTLIRFSVDGMEDGRSVDCSFIHCSFIWIICRINRERTRIRESDLVRETFHIINKIIIHHCRNNIPTSLT